MIFIFSLKKVFVFTGILFLLTFYSCNEKKQIEARDFSQIQKSKELTMITLSSSHSYFIYKDEPLGYDYELCKEFCDHYGLELKVKVAENAAKLIEMLENGEGDLIAYPIALDKQLKNMVIYCGPVTISHQVLVQRATKRDTILNDVSQLIGKEIFVKHQTKYHQRLENLNAELGGGMLIKDIEKDTVTVEDLIGMVSAGEIKYTVADEYIAKFNKTYYNNLDISLVLSFEQRSSWVVKNSSPILARVLNDWFKANEYKPTFKSLTKKYFELSKLPAEGEYLIPKNLPKGNISLFDDLFKKHAQGTDLEWQLLAAIAYQESRFETNLSSWAGATGLMGLMPRTAKSLGISVEDRTNPDLSIMASVKLLKRLDKLFSKITDNQERLKFVLAAYNGGNGHIFDAQALAEKYEEDPHTWESVKKYVLLKNTPEYYNDPVVKNGYFRGTETVKYVDQVINYWQKFKEARP